MWFQRTCKRASITARQRAMLSCNHSDAEGKKFAEDLNSVLNSSQLEMLALRKLCKKLEKELKQKGHVIKKAATSGLAGTVNHAEDATDESLRLEAAKSTFEALSQVVDSTVLLYYCPSAHS